MKYIEENTAILVSNPEDIEEVGKIAHDLGLRWKDGNLYIMKSYSEFYEGELCYYLYKGEFCSYEYYLTMRFKIIRAKEFIDYYKNKKMNIEITKERILEAAKKSAETKKVLQETFPEVFQDDKYFDFSSIKDSDLAPINNIIEKEIGIPDCIGKRIIGEHKNKGFFISKRIKVEVVKDYIGHQILLLTKAE